MKKNAETATAVIVISAILLLTVTAETAILFELEPVGIVLLVFERIVVPLLAFGASECDLYAHGRASL